MQKKIKDTNKFFMYQWTMYCVGLVVTILSVQGCYLRQKSELGYQSNVNSIPDNVIQAINEINGNPENEIGIILFSNLKTKEEISIYLNQVEEYFKDHHGKPFSVILPNQKNDGDKSIDIQKSSIINRISVKEKLNSLRVCTTSCADGIGVFNVKTKEIYEGYNRLLKPEELYQRISL